MPGRIHKMNVQKPAPTPYVVADNLVIWSGAPCAGHTPKNTPPKGGRKILICGGCGIYNADPKRTVPLTDCCKECGSHYNFGNGSQETTQISACSRHAGNSDRCWPTRRPQRARGRPLRSGSRRSADRTVLGHQTVRFSAWDAPSLSLISVRSRPFCFARYSAASASAISSSGDSPCRGQTATPALIVARISRSS